MSAKWCAPHVEDNRITCYSLDQLKNIAREYNKTCPSHRRIKINKQTKTQLWHNIRKSLNDRCNNEICWIDQDFINDKRPLKESFRPKMPKVWKEENYTTWLNTDDINRVMRQYEKKYPDFLFIGTVPLDCGIDSNLHCQLTNFDVNKAYKNGIKTIGMVYNTGKSWTSGEHWFACFIDLRRKTCSFEHYDSYASKPKMEIYNLYERVKKQLKNGNNMDVKFNMNKVAQQRDFYSCGIYSMFYIIKRLEGKTLSQIDRMKLDTPKMQKLKKEWYRN